MNIHTARCLLRQAADALEASYKAETGQGHTSHPLAERIRLKLKETQGPDFSDPSIPDGWAALTNGDTLNAGDRWFCYSRGRWIKTDSPGYPASFWYIRKIK